VEKGDEHQWRERELACPERKPHREQEQKAPGVGAEHERLPVKAVDEQSSRQLNEQVRKQSEETDCAGFTWGAGEREDEQRIRDRRHARSHRRSDKPRPEKNEVAIATERTRSGSRAIGVCELEVFAARARCGTAELGQVVRLSWRHRRYAASRSNG